MSQRKREFLYKLSVELLKELLDEEIINDYEFDNIKATMKSHFKITAIEL
jgi:hypothetical protein